MSVWQDVRWASRVLAKRRGFTATAVATFATGIAAATAVYSVVDAVLIRPLPYEDAGRLVQILTHRIEGRSAVRSGTMARPHFVTLRDSAHTLSTVGAYDSFSNVTRRRLAMAIEGDQGVAELLGTRVSPALLSMLGTAPALGRVFESAEEQPGRNDVIILGHRAWRTHFGGDFRVLGRSLRLGDRAYAVVGVMPQGFSFPDRQTDFWIPLTPAPLPPPSAPRSDSPRSAYADGVFGRLQDGFTTEAAAAEVESILRRVDRELAVERNRSVDESGFPTWMPRRAEIVSMKDELVAPARPLLQALSFAVACVLLIAGGNGVNLLLANAASRQREMATRVALGAGRLALLRQALAESVLLSLAGGALGVPLAYGAVRAIARLAPTDLPRIQDVGMGVPLLACAFVLSATMGIAAGIVPALGVARGGRTIESLLRAGATAGISAPGFVGFGWRRLLVAGEIALAVTLLAGTGLLLRRFASLSRVDLGYDPDGVFAFQVVAPPSREVGLLDFYAEVIARLGQMPGVEAAGATDVLPIAGASSYRFSLQGLPAPSVPGDWMVMRLVSPDYFRAMGIRVLAGRTFSEGASAAHEVVLNQELSRRYFGGQDPLGRVVRQGADSYEVVGVVAGVRHGGVHAPVESEYYVDLRHSGLVATRPPYFVARSTRAASDLAPALRALVLQLDPGAAVGVEVSAMADVVAESLSRPRFNTALVGAFAAIAMVLAAVAIYGVMAYFVTQRSREIGVRVALGARRADVISLVLRQGALMTGLGVLLGLAGARAVTRFMQAMLSAVEPLDATTYLVAALAFAVVSALASSVPAYRATKVDPTVALRAE